MTSGEIGPACDPMFIMSYYELLANLSAKEETYKPFDEIMVLK
jgi:hypothetical protein